MMIYTIHYDGKYTDSFTVSGEDIEDIRQTARAGAEQRGWDEKDCWSEKVERKTK